MSQNLAAPSSSVFERSLSVAASAWTDQGEANSSPLHREEAISLMKAVVVSAIKDEKSPHEIYGSEAFGAVLNKISQKKDFLALGHLAQDLGEALRRASIDASQAGLENSLGKWAFQTSVKKTMVLAMSQSATASGAVFNAADAADLLSGLPAYDDNGNKTTEPPRQRLPANAMRRPSKDDLDGTMRWAEELLSAPGMTQPDNRKRAIVLYGMAQAMAVDLNADQRRGKFTGDAFVKAIRPLAQAVVRNDLYVFENIASALAQSVDVSRAGIERGLNGWRFSTEMKKELARLSTEECDDIFRQHGYSESVSAMISTISGSNRPQEARPVVQRNFSINIRF